MYRNGTSAVPIYDWTSLSLGVAFLWAEPFNRDAFQIVPFSVLHGSVQLRPYFSAQRDRLSRLVKRIRVKVAFKRLHLLASRTCFGTDECRGVRLSVRKSVGRVIRWDCKRNGAIRSKHPPSLSTCPKLIHICYIVNRRCVLKSSTWMLRIPQRPSIQHVTIEFHSWHGCC